MTYGIPALPPTATSHVVTTRQTSRFIEYKIEFDCGVDDFAKFVAAFPGAPPHETDASLEMIVQRAEQGPATQRWKTAGGADDGPKKFSQITTTRKAGRTMQVELVLTETD